MEFIRVYILYVINSTFSAKLFRELYIGTLMIPPINIIVNETYNQKNYIVAAMTIPPLLLLLTGGLGIIVKKWAPKEKSLFGTLVYEEMVFGNFLRVANIFAFNLVFNSISLAKLLNTKNLVFVE